MAGVIKGTGSAVQADSGDEIRLTPRARAKAERREEILTAASKLMSKHGFRGVRLDDIGQAVGVSGPAMYRHFSSKEDLLMEMLTDISERLHAAAEAVVASESDPGARLDGLIAVHVDFVITEPDLISVQYRDLEVLPETARRKVRSLQRHYLDIWTKALQRQNPALDDTSARVRVSGGIGLLNSSPRFPRAPREYLRHLLTAMVRAAMTVEAE